MAAAVCMLVVTVADSPATLLGHPPAPARYDPAIGGALFADFLVGRVSTMAAKAIARRTSSGTIFSSHRPRL